LEGSGQRIVGKIVKALVLPERIDAGRNVLPGAAAAQRAMCSYRIADGASVSGRSRNCIAGSCAKRGTLRTSTRIAICAPLSKSRIRHRPVDVDGEKGCAIRSPYVTASRQPRRHVQDDAI